MKLRCEEGGRGKKAAGQKVEGELNNTWGEANLYKFMETAAYALAVKPDADLEWRFEEVIKLLAAAQQPDGYLHAYVTNNKKTPWDPDFLDGSHDGYVLGHLIEAALAHYAATGRRETCCCWSTCRSRWKRRTSPIPAAGPSTG